MIIGSHNTMSYRKPLQWWLRPLAFTARCQAVGYRRQYVHHQVRLFDLRLWFIGNKIFFRHGLMRYDASDVYDMLRYLDYQATFGNLPVYVRIVLEEPLWNSWRTSMVREAEKSFCGFCQNIEYRFPELRFFGGFRKCDNKPLYHFKTKEPTLIHRYSSTTEMLGGKHGSIRARLDDWFPWIYARLNNHRNINLMSSDTSLSDEDTCLFLDYVNIK